MRIFPVCMQFHIEIIRIDIWKIRLSTLMWVVLQSIRTSRFLSVYLREKVLLVEKHHHNNKKISVSCYWRFFLKFASSLISCLLSLSSKGDALAKRGYVMAILIVRISLMRIIARAICVDHQNTLVLMIPPSAYSLRSSAMGEEIVLMDLMKAIFVVFLFRHVFLIIFGVVCHNNFCWKKQFSC